MGVITESLMKWRALANAAVDQIRIFSTTQRKYIRFNGDEQFTRRIWELAENRLAADDDKLICAGDSCRRSNNMLKLRSLHGAEDATLFPKPLQD